MCSIGLAALRSVAQILILNVGLYVVDYGLDINAYLYQKSKGHHKWATGILLVTFLPNVIGFIYELTNAASLVERYALRKYEAFYHMQWDWKNQRIYHVYMDVTYRKWEDLTRINKTLYISRIIIHHFCIAILIILVSVPLMCLLPFITVSFWILEYLSIMKVTEIVTEYLDRNLYGWVIGYNRVIDARDHNRRQLTTHDMLLDLIFNDRYYIKYISKNSCTKIHGFSYR